MKRWRHLFRLMFVLLALQACSVVPHTQRKALILTSPSQEMAIGEEAYREVLSKAKLSKNKKWVLIVDRVIMAAIGVGANLGVLLPYSRKHETEADNIGTLYMAKAGYDPYEAVALWERFANAGQGSPPAFFSTHPPSIERAEALRTIAKKVMVEYQRVPSPYGKGESLF